MDRGPAVEPVADVSGDAFLAGDRDGGGDEALLLRLCTCGSAPPSRARHAPAAASAAISEPRGDSGVGLKWSSVAGSPGPLCPHPRAGGDDEGAVGAGKSVAHRLDGQPVRLADLLESREVVDEAGVNHPVRRRRAPRRLSRSSRSPRCTSAPAAASALAPVSERERPSTVWPAFDKVPYDLGADEAGRACDKYTHQEASLN